MSIAIACDHGGYQLKEALKRVLEDMKEEVVDLGTDSEDSVDYPDFGMLVGEKVSRGDVEKGVLVCGTGIGMSIVANKFPGVRAALAGSVYSAQMAKEHNNANILILGGRVTSPEEAVKMVRTWLTSVYEGGRHQKRLDKITELETKNFR